MSYDLMFEKAYNLYEAGAYNQAEQIYRQILEAMPQHPDVINMLGLIAQAKGLHKEAAEYFYSALNISPSLPVYFSLAVSLTASGHFKEAVSAYNTVINLKPDLKEAYNNLGGVYEQLNEKSKAAMYYRKALEIDSAYVEPAVNLAVLEKDCAALQKLSAQYPDSPLPLYYLAQDAFKNGNYTEARSLIDQAIRLSKANSEDLRLFSGLIELKLGNDSSAAQEFRMALDINPKCVSAILNLANLQKNEQLFQQALSISPENAEAHAAYGRYLYGEQRRLEALESFRKAILINPNLPEVSNNLGLILKDMKEYEQALDLFFNALLQLPDCQEISINITETLILLFETNPELAKQIAASWVKYAPDNQLAIHTFSSLTGEPTGENQQYVQILFDNFAATYEKTINNLNYNIFNKIKELEIELKGKILDLGCGTGLAALAFKNADNVFDGVDISSKMLEIASSRNLYRQLFQTDIVDFLQNNDLKYDVIIALDVFNYLDDITKVVELTNKTPLLFTIENALENVDAFQLVPSGRYQHNPLFINNLLHKNGYKQIRQYPLDLRQENGKDVKGTLFFASPKVHSDGN